MIMITSVHESQLETKVNCLFANPCRQQLGLGHYPSTKLLSGWPKAVKAAKTPGVDEV